MILIIIIKSLKAEAILILAKSLNKQWRGITKLEGVCGGDACIEGTRIPIWVLVNAHNIGVTESQLLEDYPSLTASDLANAWVYAQIHFEEITAAIKENEEV
jgi:uncharacterized protein (DUF433 family)